MLRGRILDYGCGHGSDVKYLEMSGMDVSGYDPYWLPEEPVGSYDTITCTYVLNVVGIDQEKEIIERIRRLLSPGGRAFLTVRRDLKGLKNPNIGVVTRRGMQRHVELSLPLLLEERGKYCTYLLLFEV